MDHVPDLRSRPPRMNIVGTAKHKLNELTKMTRLGPSDDADSEELVRSLMASRYRLLASVGRTKPGDWRLVV